MLENEPITEHLNVKDTSVKGYSEMTEAWVGNSDRLFSRGNAGNGGNLSPK